MAFHPYSALAVVPTRILRTSRPAGLNRLLLSFALALAIPVSGCDAIEPDSSPPEAGGSAATLRAPASLASAGFDLFIEAVGSTRGDFLFKPVDIPPEGEFVVELFGGPSPYTVLARVLHRGLSDERTQVEVDVSEFGSGGFSVGMLLGGQAQYSENRLGTVSEAVGSLAEAPTSFHYEVIEGEDGRTVMVTVDYEREAVGGGGLAWITPSSGGEEVPCSDLQVVPAKQLDAAMQIVGVRMRGVSVGEFDIVEQQIE